MLSQLQPVTCCALPLLPLIGRRRQRTSKREGIPPVRRRSHTTTERPRAHGSGSVRFAAVWRYLRSLSIQLAARSPWASFAKGQALMQPMQHLTRRRFCSAMPRCWCSRLGQGLHARRGNAGLDEVQEDPSDLGGIGDDGKHLHGGRSSCSEARLPRRPWPAAAPMQNAIPEGRRTNARITAALPQRSCPINTPAAVTPAIRQVCLHGRCDKSVT